MEKALIRKYILFICMLFLCFAAQAQSLENVTLKRIRVGVFVSPPFVMVENEGWYSGMAIDLWEMIESELGFVTEYVEYNSLENLIRAVIASEVEVAVTNLTVTYERAQQLKFTFPWYDAGMRIMVKNENGGSIWNEMKRNGHLEAYAWIILIILIVTVILTVIYRNRNPEYPRSWPEGLTLSLYNLMVAVKTGILDNKGFTWLGHILAVIWMIFGIALIAYVTSSITSSMTKMSLTSEIHSLSDLPGKAVGVESGGVSQEYLGNRGIQTFPYDHIMEAADALDNGDIQAIVGDAPVMEYWTFNNKERNMKVVGNLFHPDKYAFAANKSYGDLIDSISVELIKLYDTESIKRLKDRYFGNMHQ